MTAKEKLIALARHYGFTIQGFSAACGYDKPQAFYDVTSGKTMYISQKMADRITEAYPEVNRSWLMADEGEMIRALPASPWETDCMSVPLYDIDDENCPLRRDPAEGDKPAERGITFTGAQEGDIAIWEKGFGMAPTIPAGSVLLLREIASWREYFGFGYVYAIGLNGGRTIVKRVLRCGQDPQNYVWLESEDPRYSGEELPKSIIKCVWMVVKVQSDIH